MIVFRKDNPSGLPEFDDMFSVPVNFISNENISVLIYFNNDNLDPEIACNRVFEVKRSIQKTQGVGRAAVNELLKGPSESEKNEGYYTNINDGVLLNSLKIENGVAYADFNEALGFQVGGSCRVSAIRAQITETLSQFETVDSVVISINGNTEEILQP